MFFFGSSNFFLYFFFFLLLLSWRIICNMCVWGGWRRTWRKISREILKNNYGMIVIYSPSTQPSIKKQVHPVEDIKVSPWRVEFGAIAAPTRSRWMSNNYITGCHRQLQLVGVRIAVQGSENQLQTEGLGLQDPRLSSPAEWEISAAIVRGTWGQYVAICSITNSPLTHNPFATLSNKVWEVYFSKEVYSFVTIVDFDSECIRIVVSRLYNIYIYIYIYTHIRICTHVHICVYTRVYICVCVSIFVCMCVCVYIYIYTHTHTHIYIYTYRQRERYAYIHIHIHLYAHTQIYIHTNAQKIKL